MVDRTLRPAVPTSHANEAEHRRQIAMRANAGVPKDGTEGMVAPLRLQSYAIDDLPPASLWTASLVYCTDDVGGAVPAFSDGTNWRRCTDRAVVSET